MFRIIEHTKTWFIASVLIICIGMGFMAVKGLNFGIDFVGGTVMQVNLNKVVTADDISAIRSIAEQYASDAIVSTVDNTDISIRSSALSSDQKGNVDELREEISTKFNINSSSWSTETVGPSIGNELRKNAILAFVISVLAMMVYIAFRFELKSGVASVVALVHDVLIVVSVYAILQIPVNSSFIAAILTVIGYSINDSIVIFDRMRENLKYMKKVSYTELTNVTLTQTMTRSINTGMCTLFTITAVYFIGVSAVKELALPLIIGIITGCYSSIFIASPIWVLWKNAEKKKKGVIANV